MKALKYQIGIWGLLLLTFVVTSGSMPIQKKYGTLRVYQKSSFQQSRFSLQINNRVVAKPLRNRSWFEVKIPEGVHEIKTVPTMRYSAFDGRSYEFKVEAGKPYYLEAVVEYEFFVSKMYLIEREEAEAEKHIQRFKKDEKALTFVD